MDIIPVRKVRPGAMIPQRASNGAVGYDVYASVVLNKETKQPLQQLPVTIPPGGSVLIGTGVQFAIPAGKGEMWECEVRPRSGLANRFDIELSNSPGTVDPDFRGEAGVLLRNRGNKDFVVEPGMRVAQLVFSTVKIPIFKETNELPPTTRGAGGFGSTGLFAIKEGTEEWWAKIQEVDRVFMGVVDSLAKVAEIMNLPDPGACIIVQNGTIISTSVGNMDGSLPMLSPVEVAFFNLLHNGSGVSTKGSTVYTNVSLTEAAVSGMLYAGVAEIVLHQKKDKAHKAAIKLIEQKGVAVRYA